MKKTIVNKRVLRRLKRIREDLEKHGESGLCPKWEKLCDSCREYFPIRIQEKDPYPSCPCYLYTPGYLIRRLNKIIQDSEEKL